MEIIEYKYEDLSNQFFSLDNRLMVIVYALAGYIYHNFKKPIVITEIYRTQETQDLYYGNNEQYKIKKWFSVHQYWRGVDCSVRYYTEEEQKMALKFINDSFVYRDNSMIQTGIIHTVNSNLGTHLHLQVDGANDFTKVVR